MRLHNVRHYAPSVLWSRIMMMWATRSQTTNYRPISLLPTTSKLYEKTQSADSHAYLEVFYLNMMFLLSTNPLPRVSPETFSRTRWRLRGRPVLPRHWWFHRMRHQWLESTRLYNMQINFYFQGPIQLRKRLNRLMCVLVCFRLYW